MNQRSLWVKIRSGALSVVLLSSCAGTPPLGGEAGQGLQVVNATEMPPPSGVDTSGPQRPYLLGASDEILVDVIGVDELTERKFQLDGEGRSEEHTSELQSPMRISYAVFCLKKNTHPRHTKHN